MKYSDSFSNEVMFDYENPSTFWVRGIINEGLIKTYNPRKTCNYIYKALNGRFDYKIETLQYKILAKTDIELLEQLKKCMACCGYYMNKKPKYNTEEGTVICVFKTKYSSNIGLHGVDYIYHFAPKYIDHKIQEMGFVPKSKNDFFLYPGRIHFIYKVPSYESLMGYGNKLCSANMNKLNNGDYVLYTLDTHKIHNVRFQKDPDWLGVSVYTYDNVPYNAVISRQEIHFENPGSGFIKNGKASEIQR